MDPEEAKEIDRFVERLGRMMEHHPVAQLAPQMCEAMGLTESMLGDVAEGLSRAAIASGPLDAAACSLLGIGFVFGRSYQRREFRKAQKESSPLPQESDDEPL